MWELGFGGLLVNDITLTTAGVVNHKFPFVSCCCCWNVASIVSDSVRPHRRQPIRLPHPWGSPGKSTGVGCHSLLQCMKVKSESDIAQSCPTLSDPMDCSPPGSSVHGIFHQEHWSGYHCRLHCLMQCTSMHQLAFLLVHMNFWQTSLSAYTQGKISDPSHILMSVWKMADVKGNSLL